MRKSSKKNLTTQNKSVIFKLKAKNLINDSLLVSINNLTIEDLIAIKLELSARHINNRPYGFNIWRKANKMIRESFLKFAYSTTNSKKAAARFLGIDLRAYKELLKEYKVEEFFSENKKSTDNVETL